MRTLNRAGFWGGRRVLVTGAGGFLGSWLSHALVEHGAGVTVIMRDEVRLSNFQLLGLASCVNVVWGSITDYSLVERTLNEYEVDTCFHLAAQAIVGAANRSPVSTFHSNIMGTWNVLEACRVSGLVERLVVASSDKAYGTQPRLPYTEEMPLRGINPYDVSKVCTDVLAQSYHHAFGLPLAITRCANIYGGGDLNFSRLIPGTIQAALAGERPVIRSDGTPVRDYIYVDDVVSAYLMLAEQLHREEVRGQAFNLGTGQPVSALQMAEEILAACSRPDVVPDVRGSGQLTGEIDRQFLCSRKAASLFGWMPEVPRSEALRRTVGWYRAFMRCGEPPALSQRPDQPSGQALVGIGWGAGTRRS